MNAKFVSESLSEYVKLNEISTDWVSNRIENTKISGRGVSDAYSKKLRDENDHINREYEKREVAKKTEEQAAKFQAIFDIMNADLGKKQLEIIMPGTADEPNEHKRKVLTSINGSRDGIFTIYFNTLTASGGVEGALSTLRYDANLDKLEYSYINPKGNRTILKISELTYFYPELLKMFKKCFPESKYADRKTWSGLE